MGQFRGLGCQRAERLLLEQPLRLSKKRRHPKGAVAPFGEKLCFLRRILSFVHAADVAGSAGPRPIGVAFPHPDADRHHPAQFRGQQAMDIPQIRPFGAFLPRTIKI